MGKIIAQIIIILMPLGLSIFFPLGNIFSGIGSLFIDLSSFTKMISDIIENPKLLDIIWGIFLSILIYLSIRRVNKNKIFNRGEKYHSYPLWVYCIAGKILGYEKVSLIRVPIYLQYQLLFKDVFREVLVDSDVEKITKEVEITKKNMKQETNEMNLVLIDTYEIKEKELPPEKNHLPTIIIKSGNQDDGRRTLNTEFIKEIRKVTNKYHRCYNHLNIFATTNTNHNRIIVNKCFKNAGRTGFESILVYQALRRTFVFNEWHKVT